MIERPDKLNNEAINLASSGLYNEAIACFKRAIIIEQNNYLLWYNLGITYRDCGDLSNARKSLEKAYALVPENQEVLETLATICISSALDYSYIGLELNDGNAAFWNLAGVVYFNTEAYDDASENFEMALCINPYYADALYNLRDTYCELNNKIGVEECNKKIKELKL